MSNMDFRTYFSNKKLIMQMKPSIISHGINYSHTTVPPIQQEDYITDINEIFSLIKAESLSNIPSSSYQSITLLSFYIRRNRQNLDEIIKKISFFFQF